MFAKSLSTSRSIYATRCFSASSRTFGVNEAFLPNQGRFPKFNAVNNQSRRADFKKHNKPNWTAAEQEQAIKDHSIFTWGASDPLRELSVPVARAEGVYLYDHNGKQYFDLSSQAICANLGHTVPESVTKAITEQLGKVCYVYADLYTTEARARLGSLLAEVFPADLNAFLFASGGAEANEGAIRMARKFTGRHKIITRYRSYHGGTTSALALTGDSRRWSVDASTTGFVKMMDPFPFHFRWDDANEAKGIEKCLNALHDQILFEGPSTIAAIFLESITGSNGWLLPSPSFLQGIRALCDQYGILLICDEVMTGFGRTGKMFGFEHADGVVPDMVTFAKGVTASYLPLSGIAVRQHIFDFFRTNPVGYGSTYAAHPVACAAAYETVKYLQEKNVVEHVKQMEKVMKEELILLGKKFKCVRQARVVGLAGGFDLADKNGNLLMNMHEPHEGINVFKRKCKEEGVYTLIRGHFVHCCPPLISTEEEIRDGFKRLTKCLECLDDYIEKH